MKFVLIVAFVTGNAGLQYPSFTMQEFDSLASCNGAKLEIEKMSVAMANTGREIVRASCKPK